MDQEIINLYDEYTHKPLSRSEFINRLALLTGGMAAALALLPKLESNYSIVRDKGEDLLTRYEQYPGTPGPVTAYVARLQDEKKYPAIIVIHENRGLTPHIEDVTRRVARAGYLAIAPNALSAIGEQPASEDEARARFTQLKPEDNLANFLAAFKYLSTRRDFNGHVGCVGFCWGGGMANNLAVHEASLKAAVAYYGAQPKTEDVPNIQAAVLLHYAGLDERINAGKDAYIQALKDNHKTFEAYVYDGVQHAFNNDTSAGRYNEAAATLAWTRTLDFFAKYVKA